MTIIIIIVIAFAIIFYFSFFSGKESPAAPELSDETLEDMSIDATVKDKLVDKGVSSKHHRMMYIIIFECDDGKDLEFTVSQSIYDLISIGDRNTLVYYGNQFVGFGDVGAVDSESDDVAFIQDDGFSYEDYDENIDIEMEIDAPKTKDLSPENQEYFDLFNDREKLPVKSETLSDETDSFKEYPVIKLLERVTLYPFIKREADIRRLFFETYKAAMDDMLGFEGDCRRGRAADSVFINKNEFRLLIILQENPKPFAGKITCEFGVNE